MDSNEKIIYGHIKNVGNKGIWVKDLKQKSNIHTKNVQDAVKSLEKKQFIKSVKSVKVGTACEVERESFPVLPCSFIPTEPNQKSVHAL
jgi:hypothetical protein